MMINPDLCLPAIADFAL